MFLKEETAGSTFAVYDRVVYLQRSEGSMIVLARPDAGNGPGFILVAHEGSLKTGQPSFFPDERFEAGRGLVKIGGGRIIIDAGDADVWEPSLMPMSAHRLSGLDECLNIVCTIARSRGCGCLIPFLDRPEWRCGPDSRMRSPGISDAAVLMREKVRLLADALAGGREAEGRLAAQRLIGLGEGLTPSCDDLLVGLAGFLHAVQGDPSVASYARRTIVWLGEIMGSAGGRTTPVAAHFLSEAGRGRFTERVKELLEAIFAADKKRVETAGERVLEYGSTSGADLICGISLGYEIAIRHGGKS